MKEKILVSFCIPTYNQRDAVYKLVSDILKYDKDDIEVVVSDNHSTDGTYERLAEIEDKRLHVYQNEKNIGGAKNFYQALDKGRGKYLLTFNDKDTIRWKNIGKFLEVLQANEEFAVGYVDNTSFKTIAIRKQRHKYMSTLCWRHSTGCIFNRKLFRSIDAKEFFYDTCTMPLMFLGMKMVSLGSVLSIRLNLWKMYNYNIGEHKSTYYSDKESMLQNRYTIEWWKKIYEEYQFFIRQLIRDKKNKIFIEDVFLEYFTNVCVCITKTHVNISGMRKRYNMDKKNDNNRYYFRMCMNSWKIYFQELRKNEFDAKDICRLIKGFWAVCTVFWQVCILSHLEATTIDYFYDKYLRYSEEYKG